MKRFSFFVLFLLPELYLSAQTASDQNNYDKYQPREYTPMRYFPKSTGGPLVIRPYTHEPVVPTAKKLYTFINQTKSTHPELKSTYKGDWNAYVDLCAKYMARGRDYENLSKKKQMKYFQEDWELLDRSLYDDDYQARKEAKERSIKDSLARRDRFVSDSIQFRTAFVKDSLAGRRKFVDDSLYRADYRKKHNYDYVVFDGPHGEPRLCYRNGKLIDGKIYNEYGLLEKEYKGGRLIYDCEYSDWYSKAIKDEHFDRGRDHSSFYIYDKILRRKRYYYSGNDVREGRIGRDEYYNAAGLLTKKIGYEYIDYEYLDKMIIDYLEYYPDNKTVKRQKVTYFSDSDISRMGNVAVMDFFSNGSRRQTKKYRKLSSGNLIIKEIWTYRDGYADVEYYDFDGNLERRSTEYLNSSWF